jgi:hypothetical protein
VHSRGNLAHRGDGKRFLAVESRVTARRAGESAGVISDMSAYTFGFQSIAPA